MEQPFKPHENLADEVNQAIVESELYGGVDLKKVPVGQGLHIYTKKGYYLLAHCEDGFYLREHPFKGESQYASQLTPVRVTGSVFSKEGSMIKSGWIGRGMYLEFHLNGGPRLLSSTPILEITEY
jgi:hypothetical protein